MLKKGLLDKGCTYTEVLRDIYRENLSEERFSPNKYSVLLLYEYSPIQQSLLERLALVLSVCYFIILCFFP